MVQQKMFQSVHPNNIFLYYEKNIATKNKILFLYLVFIFDTQLQHAEKRENNKNHKIKDIMNLPEQY